MAEGEGRTPSEQPGAPPPAPWATGRPPRARPERVRLFVALPLPEDLRAELSEWTVHALRRLRRHGAAGPAGDLRPVEARSLHVTLCFLGARPAESVARIAEVCRTAAPGPLVPLTLDRPLWLPARRPRVLSVQLTSDPDELSPLQARLAGALAADGLFEPEDRPFLPHVTVGRVRRGAQVRPVELRPPEPLVEVADRVVLYRSHLGGPGARYEALETVELG